MKHHQCFDACLLTEKLTIIASFYISVFSHYKSSRRASCSCIGCRWESATERVKERTARQLWRITVGEWSHWRNRADSVTRHFSLTFITWNFAYIKKCFQGFLLKKTTNWNCWVADCIWCEWCWKGDWVDRSAAGGHGKHDDSSRWKVRCESVQMKLIATDPVRVTQGGCKWKQKQQKTRSISIRRNMRHHLYASRLFTLTHNKRPHSSWRHRGGVDALSSSSQSL